MIDINQNMIATKRKTPRLAGGAFSWMAGNLTYE